MSQNIYHPSFQGFIGVARTNITPPVGIYSRNWGAAKHDVAVSIHRSLNLTALTISQASDTQPLVYLDLDLGWWKTPQSSKVFRQQILDALSLPSENLIVGLTHTHAGPPLMEAEEELPGSDILKEWFAGLVDKAVGTIRASLTCQTPATLDWHYGHCNLATNRDFPDPNPEQDRVICGYNPDAEADNTLLLGRVSDNSGKVQATLVNYACHPTTLAWENTAVSPDYIGAMREVIEANTQSPSLFLFGACGDLAPKRQYVGDPEIADRNGRQLGFAALATLHDMLPPQKTLEYSQTMESGAPLAVWELQDRNISQELHAHVETLPLPLKDWPTAAELEAQRIACEDRALEERLRRKRDIRRSVGDTVTFPLELHAWKLGEAILIGSCCEPYSKLQIELRNRFPGKAIACLNVINGSIGYLPPAELYDKDVYPVWQTPFDKGALEATIETMSNVIALMTNDEDLMTKSL